MANSERGAYEPRIDSIHSFDAMDEDDDAQEGSKLPLLIVIALVVLGAFAGIVWLAYTQGVERGRADAPRATAESVSPRVAGATPYTGPKIYQQPGSSDAGDADSVPPPPTRAAKPPPPPALRPSAAAVTETPAETDDFTATQAKPVVPAPVATHPPAELGKPVLASVSPKVAAPPSATELHGVLLQIGSYKSDAEARQAWVTFQARHAVVSGDSPDVKEVDLGAKGVWYRLRVGAFADQGAATAVCERLKSDGASCLIAK